MIVRISGEGQFEVPDGHVDELNRLDEGLTKAVDAGDEAEFKDALEALLGSVRTAGEELPGRLDRPLRPGPAQPRRHHPRSPRGPRRRGAHPGVTS